MTKSLFKQILLAGLGVCLMLVSSLAFAACGEKQEEPWGKTYAYSSTTDIAKTRYTIEGKELTLEQVVSDYFDDINWQTTLNKTKDEVGNASNALTLLKQACAIEKTDLTFKFSSKEDSTVEIDGQKYQVTLAHPEGNTDVNSYKITIGSGENEELYIFRYESLNELTYIRDNLISTGTLPNSMKQISLIFNEKKSMGSGEDVIPADTITISSHTLYKAI